MRKQIKSLFVLFLALSIFMNPINLCAEELQYEVELNGNITDTEDEPDNINETELGVAVTPGVTSAIVISPQGLCLRKDPSYESSILVYLDYEEILTVIEKLDSWLQVVTQDKLSGYVVKDFTMLVNDYIFFPRSIADEMIDIAYQYIGTPYVWGGNSLEKGVDCSGFVKQLFATQGIDTPRTAQTISRIGVEVSFDSLIKGDLLFFGRDKDHITHVAMFIKDNIFIHSASGGIQISDFDTSYYTEKLILCKRIL